MKLSVKVKLKKRCPWGQAWDDPLMLEYHDKEWGKPLRPRSGQAGITVDRKIFEFLILEAFQAGLSWRTVLYKRENFRKAFAGFDPAKVARFGPKDVNRLLKDAGIIRNRLKILAAIENARRFLEVKKEFGTFSKYMWSWVKGKPIKNRIRTIKDYQPTCPEGDAWAKDLKKRGFKFLGPTTLYAHMQAVGMVNDHSQECFRR